MGREERSYVPPEVMEYSEKEIKTTYQPAKHASLSGKGYYEASSEKINTTPEKVSVKTIAEAEEALKNHGNIVALVESTPIMEHDELELRRVGSYPEVNYEIVVKGLGTVGLTNNPSINLDELRVRPN
jgi:glutamine synthetase type III